MAERANKIGFPTPDSNKTENPFGIVTAAGNLADLLKQIEEALALRKSGEASLEQESDVGLLHSLNTQLTQLTEEANGLGISPHKMGLYKPQVEAGILTPGQEKKKGKSLGFSVPEGNQK